MAKEMKTFVINALVRDNRVALFEEQGCKVASVKLAPAAAEEKLRGKVMEEATELALAEEETLLKEAADLVESTMALLRLNGFSQDDLAKKMAERRAELGAFEELVFIDTLSAPVGSETYAYHKANSDKYPLVEAAGADA